MADAAATVGEALKRAIGLHQAGRLAEAETLYKAILDAAPGHFDALHLLGVIASQTGRHAEAERLIGRALGVRPDVAPAQYNRGNALLELGRYAEALACYDKAIALKPDYPEALYHRGNALLALDRFDAALESYDRALAIRPGLPEALNNRGNVLKALARPEEALASYDRALALRPDYVEATYNRGILLEESGRLDEALSCYDRVVALKADHALALNSRGNVLTVLRRHEDAAQCFARLASVAPEFDYALGRDFHARLQCCDWTDYAGSARRIEAAVGQGRRAVLPFSLLSMPSSPMDQLACARAFAADRYPPAPDPLWTGQRYAHDRIRLAYVSADFRDHPVPILIVGLFEQHDRARFEVTGISLNPEDDSAMGRRIRAAFDRHVDASRMGDRAVAEQVRALEIDIAVDLSGFTHGNRTAIFAHRPAPVQVNYLGYPGTMGAPYMDYIVADAAVIPAAERGAFAEQVVHLPHSYQANDSRRAIAERTPTRAEAGLPETGFVFCCFNKNYKIAPGTFDAWMRLLRQVDGSVLWLLESSEAATRNLWREAERRGVDAGRIVFAPRVRPDEHLARHRLAGLFLDTLPYNAHTTASDALWAGLPLVTCTGGTFAGRVAASLLGAAGMPELITSSDAEYEALALKLATTPALLAELKAKLALNRATCPLFDTALFRRHIEQAYVAMRERSQRGDKPQGFAVPA
ncbi:MAG: tetratricopeptide repeat protein [Alphaproteobacteria bacterium]|nr:tetratricopeptide repeat protein [Alphaproteobacteria bacterium]